MNTQEHIKKLSCARKTLKTIQNAKERVALFDRYKTEMVSDIFRAHYKNRIDTLTTRVIPRLEIRYRRIIHELSNLQ